LPTSIFVVIVNAILMCNKSVLPLQQHSRWKTLTIFLEAIYIASECFEILWTLAYRIILKLFAITLQITFEKFQVVDSDLTRINLRLHAKFGPSGFLSFRAYLGHRRLDYRQTHKQDLLPDLCQMLVDCSVVDRRRTLAYQDIWLGGSWFLYIFYRAFWAYLEKNRPYFIVSFI